MYNRPKILIETECFDCENIHNSVKVLLKLNTVVLHIVKMSEKILLHFGLD